MAQYLSTEIEVLRLDLSFTACLVSCHSSDFSTCLRGQRFACLPRQVILSAVLRARNAAKCCIAPEEWERWGACSREGPGGCTTYLSLVNSSVQTGDYTVLQTQAYILKHGFLIASQEEKT